MTSEAMSISVDESIGAVSALHLRPPDARCLYLLAHGAGAGMRHAFMEDMARRLASHQIATLRFQFPYTEAGKKRPDPPRRLEATVRAAAAHAARIAGDLPVIAGGKSMGGRITSQAQAQAPLPQVRGLVFLGFPLHAAGKPDDRRAAHLAGVDVPMLFLQGTRDALADLSLLRPHIEVLRGARLHVVDDGDHSFAVRKRSGRSADEVGREIAGAIASWAETAVLSRV